MPLIPNIDGTILASTSTESCTFRGPRARQQACQWCAERGEPLGDYAPKDPDRVAGLEAVLDFFK